jgi:hypothetical protein
MPGMAGSLANTSWLMPVAISDSNIHEALTIRMFICASDEMNKERVHKARAEHF